MIQLSLVMPRCYFGRLLKIEICTAWNNSNKMRMTTAMIEIDSPISTILFLTKNELPFRGDWNIENEEELGLFLNMFKYNLERDKRLRHCQEAMPGNAKRNYSSYYRNCSSKNNFRYQ